MECLGHWFFNLFNVYIFLVFKPVKCNKMCLLVNPGSLEGSFWQLKKKKSEIKLNKTDCSHLVLLLCCEHRGKIPDILAGPTSGH